MKDVCESCVTYRGLFCCLFERTHFLVLLYPRLQRTDLVPDLHFLLWEGLNFKQLLKVIDASLAFPHVLLGVLPRTAHGVLASELNVVFRGLAHLNCTFTNHSVRFLLGRLRRRIRQAFTALGLLNLGHLSGKLVQDHCGWDLSNSAIVISVQIHNKVQFYLNCLLLHYRLLLSHLLGHRDREHHGLGLGLELAGSGVSKMAGL